MKSDSSQTNVKTAMAVLICAGFMAGHPLTAKADVHETLQVGTVQQQSNVTVKGTVRDAMGPVIGASVIEKDNKGNGTITDMDGKFSLSVKAGATLEIHYVGYKTVEIKAVSGTPLNVTLKENSEMLDEVVVVGYGTMRKKDVTGSVLQIRPDDISQEAPKTVADILRGTPGLDVGVSMDAKGGGSLQVRGTRSISSLTSGSPLIILDDMPFYGELSEISPEIIGQIDVLKDASAAATYGARAANGVVVITTKKGKMGKPLINLSAKVGFTTKSAYAPYYDAAGWLRYREDWYKSPTYGVNPQTGAYEAYQACDTEGNLLAEPGYFDNPLNLPSGVSIDQWRGYTENGVDESDMSIYARRIMAQTDEVLRQNFLNGRVYDWYGSAFQTGFNQDYNVSVSGASDKVNYFLSVGWLSNEGAVKNNEYSAVRANMKLSGKITPWLEISANVNFQDRTDGDLKIDVGSTVQNSPYASHTDEEGNLVVHPMGEQNAYNRGYNYDYDRQYLDSEAGYTVLNSIFNAKLKLPFNITYSFNFSPRYEFYYSRYFASAEHPDWQSDNGRVDRENQKRFDWSLNNTINWDQTFAQKHHVVLTLVQEAEKRESWFDGIYARNIQPSDALGFHNTESAGKLESSFSSTDKYQSATGLLARLFYSYDDRYMLTTSFRRDGYSAFGKNNPYANFGSVALGWTFTNEKFFRWTPMNYGKLRLSWGTNGNRALTDPYMALANLEPGAQLWGYLNKNGELEEVEYLKVSRMASPNLKWEKSEAINAGVDFGFFNNRLSGTLETYVITTKDMILNRTLPVFTGFDGIATNLGEVQNKGVELSLNTRNIEAEKFQWNTSFNFTWNKNKIKHLYYDYEDVLDDKGNVIGQKEKNEYGKWFIGRPISTIWNYKVEGIWQVEEREEAARYGQVPGDPKVANIYTGDDKVNEDGTITPVYNDKDKVFLGQTASPYSWSMRNSFTILKNIEFSFNIYSRMGGKFGDNTYLNRDGSSTVDAGQNLVKKPYWTPENPSGTYARLNATGPSEVQSPTRYLSSSFIRLDNLSLAYNFPTALLKRWNINALRIYATVQNAGILWKAADWNLGDIETRGFASRNFILGLNVTL